MWNAITAPNALHAFWLSLEIVAIAVPLNTVFGIGMRAAARARHVPRHALLDALIDLPFAISPVVVGLALVLVYGTDRLVRRLAGRARHPGDLLGARAWCSRRSSSRCRSSCARPCRCCARSAPSRSRRPRRSARARWQTFWRVTLPAIRWGVVYGVVLTTARALGEFGAVSIVSGRIEGQTQTLPLYVQDRFENFDTTGAYTAAVVLALLALVTLLAMNLLDTTHATEDGRLMAIEVRNVSKRFGDFVALDDVCDRRSTTAR